MRILFHGTSHGVPMPHRRCSSYILEVEGAYYLIDMGTAVAEELLRRGIPMEAVRLAICTHPHGNHTDGLIQFTDLINWYFTQADPQILLPDERLTEPLKAWITVLIGEPGRETADDDVGKAVHLNLRQFIFKTRQVGIRQWKKYHCAAIGNFIPT